MLSLSNETENDDDLVHSSSTSSSSRKRSSSSSSAAHESSQQGNKRVQRGGQQQLQPINHMTTDFQKFMAKHRTDLRGSMVTHMTMPSNHLRPGRFIIPDEDYDEFLRVYAKDIHAGKSIAVVENHRLYGPIVCDLDFRYEEMVEDNKRIYTAEFVTRFIALYFAQLKKYVEIPEDKMNTNFCFVTEKPACEYDTVKDIWKDGLHLVFPNIITNLDIQHYIRDVMVSETHALLSYLNQEIIDDNVENLIDDLVIEKNGWTLYGGRKLDKITNEPKGAYQIYGDETNISGLYLAHEQHLRVVMSADNKYTKPGGTGFSVNEMIRTLSIRRVHVADVMPLTTSGESVVKTFNDEKLNRLQQRMNVQHVGVNGAPRLVSKETLKKAADLVGFLSTNRAKSESSWVKVGWCLHNIDVRLLEVWIEFSKRAEEYINTAEAECTEKWNRMTNGPLAMGSLIHWAKEDNPEQVEQYFHSNENVELKAKIVLDRFISGYTVKEDKRKAGAMIIKSIQYNRSDECFLDIVDLFYEKYGDIVTCTQCYKSITWTYFHGHHWCKESVDNGVQVDHFMLTFIRSLFDHMTSKLEQKIREMSDDEDSYRLLRLQLFKKASMKLRSTLCTPLQIQSLVQACRQKFHWTNRFSEETRKGCDSFSQMIDTDRFLIGVRNGVYDLKTHEFRAGVPDDYISCYAPVDYRAYTLDHPDVQDILAFFRQVFPNERVRFYMLQNLANCLDGENVQRIFVCTGSGGNGKSILCSFMKDTLGLSYSYTAPSSMATGKRTGSSNATPDLVNLDKKRYVTHSEPEEGQNFNFSLLKDLSSGEDMNARPLFCTNVQIRLSATNFVNCNKVPGLNTCDGGVKRRLRIIEFKSCMKETPDETLLDEDGYRMEFPIDMDLSSKLKQKTGAFFWLLTYYYKINKQGSMDYRFETIVDPLTGQLRVGVDPPVAGKDTIVDPPEVLLAVNEYVEQHDPISLLVKEAVIQNDVEQTGQLGVYVTDLHKLYLNMLINRNERKEKQCSMGEFLGSLNMNEKWLGKTLKDPKRNMYFPKFRLKPVDEIPEGIHFEGVLLAPYVE